MSETLLQQIERDLRWRLSASWRKKLERVEGDLADAERKLDQLREILRPDLSRNGSGHCGCCTDARAVLAHSQSMLTTSKED